LMPGLERVFTFIRLGTERKPRRGSGRETICKKKKKKKLQ